MTARFVPAPAPARAASQLFGGDTKFDKIDCSYGTPREIAKAVNNWLIENFGNDNLN